MLQEMLERQLEYECVRLEADSRKARLEAQEKVHAPTCAVFCILISVVT